MSKRVILIVESNPRNTRRLHVNEEKRDIRDSLRMAGADNTFEVKIEHAARLDDLFDAVIRYKPEIIHFMGHGEGEAGLCLTGDDGKKQLLSNAVIDGLFKRAAQHARLVVLNACHSEEQAKIVAKHTEHVIGMSDKIPDATALAFAEKFYRYLGLNEATPEAFEMAKLSLEAHQLRDHLVPVLLSQADYQSYEPVKETPSVQPPTAQAVPVKPEQLTPSCPLMLIPTDPQYKLLADKHYREVESELASHWGLMSPRRVSTIHRFRDELAMERPDVVYVYSRVEQGQLLVDADRFGNRIDLESLAQWFKQSGVRPLLILVLLGRFDRASIPSSLQAQARFIWSLHTPLEVESALNELSHTVRLFLDRSAQEKSIELSQLVDGLQPSSSVCSEYCPLPQAIALKIDAQSQRDAQQFRAALLRMLLGREDIKSRLGFAIQAHLGDRSVLVYAVSGSELSCVFDLPQQIYYKLLPNLKSHQGVLVLNWPLHINIDAELLDDEWAIRGSIEEIIHHNIQHGSTDMGALIEKKANDIGINAETGVVMFHWNVCISSTVNEKQLQPWLEVWAQSISEKFGMLSQSSATLVHALCFMIDEHNDIAALNDSMQGFVVNQVNDYPSLRAYNHRNKPLGNLEPEEIEGFFNSPIGRHWSEYFRFTDFGIDKYALAKWVCQKTDGAFEAVVRLLWDAQQMNYREYLQESAYDRIV